MVEVMKTRNNYWLILVCGFSVGVDSIFLGAAEICIATRRGKVLLQRQPAAESEARAGLRKAQRSKKPFEKIISPSRPGAPPITPDEYRIIETPGIREIR